MKREDLFDAIGLVEESRLERTEAPCFVIRQEDSNMKKQNGKTRRVLRNLLVAAVIVSVLTVTAFATAGYLVFDSPEEMISTLFGDKTGFDHNESDIIPSPYEPGEEIYIAGFDRVPAKEGETLQEVASTVTTVGQSISWKGYTLTVDSFLYDPTTETGIVTYTLENPEGLPEYDAEPNGEVYFTDTSLVKINQWGYEYIVRDKSGENRLTVAAYFKRRQGSEECKLTFNPMAEIAEEEYEKTAKEVLEQVRRDYTPEEAARLVGDPWEDWQGMRVGFSSLTQEERTEIRYQELAQEKIQERLCPGKICISMTASEEMTSISLGGGAATLSPIAMTLDAKRVEGFSNGYIGVTKILFRDGSEYTVSEDLTCNYTFAIGSGDLDVTYMFNRLVDVSQVAAVIVDGGIELSVD